MTGAETAILAHQTNQELLSGEHGVLIFERMSPPRTEDVDCEKTMLMWKDPTENGWQPD